MKQYTVTVQPKALSDIDDVLFYSSRQPAHVLQSWYDRLQRHLAGLSVRPRRCPTASESKRLKCEIRFSVFGRRRGAFKIYFRIEANDVIVLRIKRGSRRGLGADDLT